MGGRVNLAGRYATSLGSSDRSDRYFATFFATAGVVVEL